MRTVNHRANHLTSSHRNYVAGQHLPVHPITPQHDGAFDQLDGINVLITDDQSDMRDVLFAVLSQQGAKVDITSSALEALSAIEHHASFQPYDVAIFDVLMPQVDGLSLVSRLRSMEASQGWSRLPTIAFTSFGSGVMREQALRAGFDRYVVKSVSPTVIYSTINELLDR